MVQKWVEVSVPYRGATFLNEEHLRLRERLSLSFRPLSGSYISQSFLFSPFISQLCECFRPLSGSYISQSRKQVLKNVETIVSVPYRGATFLNAFITHIAIMMMVSVPYRGATFLNCGMNATIIYYNGFPSPIGELHFSIEFGIMDEWIRYVSVPYRGATFLNISAYAVKICKYSFRPLSGSYISQLKNA